MGLINSTRSDEYAHKLYDEIAVKKIEQILILHKLNISTKDIQRIFNVPGSDVVLEVLGKKVQNIDDEIALLHEVKETMMEFIRQIENIDFCNDTDVKTIHPFVLRPSYRDGEAAIIVLCLIVLVKFIVYAISALGCYF
jgi:DNA-binding transcriptional MerR regulator